MKVMVTKEEGGKYSVRAVGLGPDRRGRKVARGLTRATLRTWLKDNVEEPAQAPGQPAPS